MEAKFDYSAFISYKREDERWAIWLQNHLERYSIPSAIRKEIPRLPKRLKPVFRDKTDLGAGGLAVSLHKELERSHFLIVICSPYSAKSEWVGKEMEYFRDLGREEQIIPFVVDGIPHSDAIEKECFHPMFDKFDDEPLGINVKEIGKQQALIKVVAKILDLRFDTLWGRHKRYLLRKRINIAISVLLMCLIGAAIWEFNRTRLVYYSDYIEGQYVEGQQSEWLKGIGEIPASTIDTLRECFRFEYKRIPLGKPQAGRWQLLRVVHQNVFGNPTEFEEQTTPFVRYPIMSIKYLYRDSMYMPERVECYNEYGNLQRIKQISGEKLDKIDFKNFKTELSFNRQTLSEFKDPLLDMLGNKYCNITHFDLERDELGNVNKVVFKASNEKNALPMTDTRKHIAMTLSRDTIGRITYVLYWTYKGTVDYLIGYNYTNYELSEKTLWRYDGHKVVQDTQFKLQYPVVHKYIFTASDSSYIRHDYHYSKGVLQQKRTEKESLIINDRPQLMDNVRYSYNKNGQIECESYLDRDNNVSYYKSFKYNEDNRVACIEYAIPSENSNIRSAIGPEGYSYAEFGYEGGLLISQHLHGRKDAYNIEYSYDKDNQLISIAYYDRSHTLANLGDFHKTIASDNYEKQVLDAINGMIDIKRAGNNDMFKGDTIYKLNWKFPFWHNYAKRVFDYDDWGNITKIRYYNDREECYIIINEDILEDGTVPSSIGYIVNQKGHRLPLASSFRPKRGNKRESSFLDPISNLLLENMFLDAKNGDSK